MRTLAQDLRYGLRQLRAAPGLTIVVILSLALGIGANTGIFSLADAVLLRILPVKNPGQLVLLRWGPESEQVFGATNDVDVSYVFSYPAFEQFRQRATALSSIFAFVPLGFTPQNTNVIVGGQPRLADGSMVTGDFFSGLGVRALLGRALTAADQRPGSTPVADISYRYWTRRFARDPAVIGRSVPIDGLAYTIVGVMPPRFHGLRPARSFDLWVPMLERPGLGPGGYPGNGKFLEAHDRIWAEIMGRLAPGESRAQAQAQLDTIFQQYMMKVVSPPPKPGTLPHIIVASGAGGMNGLTRQFEQPLLLLLLLVGLVLLVACANVAALLLARAAARQREIGVRLALGASRRRLIRQLLTESVLLACCGAALGLLFAYWGVQALASQIGVAVGLTLAPRLDLNVLVFTAVVAVVTGLLFGMLPALRATRVELSGALKDRAASGAARLGAGRALVIAQVAISLVLIAAAGLFVRTLGNLQSQDFGFPTDHILLFSVDPTETGFHGARLMAFYPELQARLAALPGVRAATLMQSSLLSGGSDNMPAKAEGVAHQPQNNNVRWDLVGPDFLRATEIPLVAGRDIGPQDTETAPHVAVVNETFARRFFGRGNPIGRHFRGFDYDWEIVGVARDAKYGNPSETIRAQAYVPYPQEPKWLAGMTFELRTYAAPTALLGEVRHAVHGLEPSLALANVKTENQEIAQALIAQRVFAWLSGFLGLLGLILAAIGLEGTMAFLVTRRTGEIGIRMALGARRGQVLSMILGQALAMVAIGIAVGLPIMLFLSRYLASLLYGVQPRDPSALVVAVVLLALVGALAAYLPARRAARVDPLAALRYE